MNEKLYQKEFKSFLTLEKALSDNTITAYISDLKKLSVYALHLDPPRTVMNISRDELKGFIMDIHDIGMSERTQARIISSLKAFYRFLLIEEISNHDPTENLDTPRIKRKLPDTISVNEINELVGAIDLSRDDGYRNKAIIETLYSCGLRVSELINLKLSKIYFKERFVRVIGKGNKERLVPIGSQALEHIVNYIENTRSHQKIKIGHEDFLFINRLGKGISRVMIFNIVKQLATKINLGKNISPHTFRHSFATHLIEGGADLRAVQEMLGHESITTTEIYTHLDREYLRDAIIQFHPRSRK